MFLSSLQSLGCGFLVGLVGVAVWRPKVRFSCLVVARDRNVPVGDRFLASTGLPRLSMTQLYMVVMLAVTLVPFSLPKLWPHSINGPHFCAGVVFCPLSLAVGMFGAFGVVALLVVRARTVRVFYKSGWLIFNRDGDLVQLHIADRLRGEGFARATVDMALRVPDILGANWRHLAASGIRRVLVTSPWFMDPKKKARFRSEITKVMPTGCVLHETPVEFTPLYMDWMSRINVFSPAMRRIFPSAVLARLKLLEQFVQPAWNAATKPEDLIYRNAKGRLLTTGFEIVLPDLPPTADQAT